MESSLLLFLFALRSPRHCDEPLRRSNPDCACGSLDCRVASLLAMTGRGRCSSRSSRPRLSRNADDSRYRQRCFRSWSAA
ncbi:hypothetical protein FNL55_22680 [Tardiphaga sp. vice352]|nr:hypothetical protein FNL53_23195 [Tardiphaga sp. vice278]QDM23520.1 hypothetical protein FIU28_21990 [Tardiphaga sp. vice154]QDM28743.1 hypothetical protein FNL56_23430 [Tardiphaga sp. vice304]QDM33844.1 hypothetical protein FNL55_22680 [Tardiphaga sp. vice352]